MKILAEKTKYSCAICKDQINNCSCTSEIKEYNQKLQPKPLERVVNYFGILLGYSLLIISALLSIEITNRNNFLSDPSLSISLIIISLTGMILLISSFKRTSFKHFENEKQ